MPVPRSSPRIGLLAILAILATPAAAPRPALGDEPPGKQAAPCSAAELFRETTVWTLRLRFAPDQWAAIEPAMRQDGGPGGMPPGPGMFVGPAMFAAADGDGDKALSAAEFAALGERWFAAWDKAGAGKVGAKELRDGLDAAFGPPPGAATEPPRMNLQGPKGKRNGISAMMGIDFEYVHAALDFEGLALPNVGVRYKGNGTFMESRGSLKRSLKIDINKYVKGQQLAGLTTLNLHNNVTDAGLMNEALAFRLYRDAGVPAPRVGYARVYVTVPGKHDDRYFGVYSVVENVDKDFIRGPLQARGGALFKPVAAALFADLGADWEAYRQTYDPKTDPTPAQERRLIDFCKLVAGATDADFAAQLGDFVDLDELARYLAVTAWLADIDGLLGPGQNFYLFLDPTSRKFLFLPWDQDHSFGQFPMRGTQEEREQLSLARPWEGKNRFLERLYRVDAFQDRYRARLKEFSAGLFRPERFEAQVRDLAAALRPAVRDESPAKLARFDKAVNGEPLPFTFGPPPPEPAEGPEPAPAFGPGGPRMAIIPIAPFARQRSASVADQVAGRSAGRTLGSTAPKPGQGAPDFSPGAFLRGLFLRELDKDGDKAISRDEFARGFAGWFDSWDASKTGRLTDAQLRAGIDKDLAFIPGGPPPSPAPPRDGPKP